MDFATGQDLLNLCGKYRHPISAIMKLRELDHGALSEQAITDKLQTALDIMRKAAREPLHTTHPSVGGLLGGEARRVLQHRDNCITGTVLWRAMIYSLAVLETNASMGLIVAAPTAGSSGVLPAVLLAVSESRELPDSSIYSGLLNASAIGCLLMRNASVAGAEAGCQAEVGSASAMAASAIVEMIGGTPQMCLQAASLAISNLLGLVCDPIAGLVESPCQSRNTIGAANALVCAELALSGVTHPVPFDEMADAMYRVGKALPVELRETAGGGNAATPTGCTIGCKNCDS